MRSEGPGTTVGPQCSDNFIILAQYRLYLQLGSEFISIPEISAYKSTNKAIDHVLRAFQYFVKDKPII